MAQVQRYRRAIAAALFGFAALAFVPAFAEDQGPNAGTDLYDRPVLAIDPDMHAAEIREQAVDAAGRFAVTGGDDHTVRIWSIADGKLLRTIWIPVGPQNVGDIYAVAISQDGSTIAAGGWTERSDGDHPIYIFDRESGNLIRRIGGDLPDATYFLYIFSRRPLPRRNAETPGKACVSSTGTRNWQRGLPRRSIWSRKPRRLVRPRRPPRNNELGWLDSFVPV